MKKYLLFFLMPLLMASQCEDDQVVVPQTDYAIENSTSIDLVFPTMNDTEIDFASMSAPFGLFRTLNPNGAVLPSDNGVFTSIQLFKRDTNGALVLAYEQNPIDDSLWTLTNLSEGNSLYTLTITDDLLN